MNPKDYYYTNFRQQFADFIQKSKAHEHPNEGTYIPIQELNAENLNHIPQEERMLFFCSLAGTILIDQVIYTHFKNDYQKFREMTLYPKIEYGISNINANPWDIAQRGSGLTTFEKFAEFFAQDLKEFFGKNRFEAATWEAVKKAMLNDSDVSRGSYGKIFVDILNRI
ncbi:hypothetical protein EPN83_02735 [Patescibacteria group bacterium]|nr:MAG: hypothetical protein EPN83_02735 [Patescibacteria group bacterium]